MADGTNKNEFLTTFDNKKGTEIKEEPDDQLFKRKVEDDGYKKLSNENEDNNTNNQQKQGLKLSTASNTSDDTGNVSSNNENDDKDDDDKNKNAYTTTDTDDKKKDDQKKDDGDKKEEEKPSPLKEKITGGLNSLGGSIAKEVTGAWTEYKPSTPNQSDHNNAKSGKAPSKAGNGFHNQGDVIAQLFSEIAHNFLADGLHGLNKQDHSQNRHHNGLPNDPKASSSVSKAPKSPPEEARNDDKKADKDKKVKESKEEKESKEKANKANEDAIQKAKDEKKSTEKIAQLEKDKNILKLFNEPILDQAYNIMLRCYDKNNRKIDEEKLNGMKEAMEELHARYTDENGEYSYNIDQKQYDSEVFDAIENNKKEFIAKKNEEEKTIVEDLETGKIQEVKHKNNTAPNNFFDDGSVNNLNSSKKTNIGHQQLSLPNNHQLATNNNDNNKHRDKLTKNSLNVANQQTNNTNTKLQNDTNVSTNKNRDETNTKIINGVNNVEEQFKFGNEKFVKKVNENGTKKGEDSKKKEEDSFIKGIPSYLPTQVNVPNTGKDNTNDGKK